MLDSISTIPFLFIDFINHKIGTICSVSFEISLQLLVADPGGGGSWGDSPLFQRFGWGNIFGTSRFFSRIGTPLLKMARYPHIPIQLSLTIRVLLGDEIATGERYIFH